MNCETTRNKPSASQPEKLKAPFPYFGGKSRVAHIVWEALGDPDVFVEPFFGSGAVTLARPHSPRREIINDADGFVANFWRAIKHAPETVARYADWPSNESDLIARYRWICEHKRKRELLRRVEFDPEHFDSKAAGYWVWVMSQWLGGGCCAGEWYGDADLRNHGTGITGPKLPRLNPNGIFAISRRDRIPALIDALSRRLRHTIVACGDWHRVAGNSGLPSRKSCAVFLDPPYDFGAGRDETLYRVEKASTSDVEKWCIEHGRRDNLRIVLAGLEGEYSLPVGWSKVEWTRTLAFAKQEQAIRNLERERLWLSPACAIGPHTREAMARRRGRRSSASNHWRPRVCRTRREPSRPRGQR